MSPAKKTMTKPKLLGSAIQTDPTMPSTQGGGRMRIPNQGLEGAVWPKAKKKIVTSPILMAEVVVDMPKGTSDGSPGVQDVFESL